MNELSQEQLQFETAWHQKTICMTEQGKLNYPYLKDQEYFVTAALLQWEGENDTIFAVMGKSDEMPKWHTIHLGMDEVNQLNSNFEVIGNLK